MGTPSTVDYKRLMTWGLYQNRNRTYSPVMGRFMQRDPNASRQVVLSDMGWFGGAGPMPPRPALAASSGAAAAQPEPNY